MTSANKDIFKINNKGQVALLRLKKEPSYYRDNYLNNPYIVFRIFKSKTSMDCMFINTLIFNQRTSPLRSNMQRKHYTTIRSAF